MGRKKQHRIKQQEAAKVTRLVKEAEKVDEENERAPETSKVFVKTKSKLRGKKSDSHGRMTPAVTRRQASILEEKERVKESLRLQTQSAREKQDVLREKAKEGAKNRREINEKINMKIKVRKLEEKTKTLEDVINAAKPINADKRVLETINRIYFGDDILLKDNFVEKFNNFYQGGIQKVDFLAAETVEKINNFIAEATRNKITNIVGKDSFDALTKIVLINAIYFKGKWSHCFPDKKTKDANFYSAAGKIKKAKMMEHYSNKWRYSETNKFQFLSLPYQDCKLSMRIILPRERFGLADLVKNLTAAELLKHLSKNKEVEVIVKMPRFEVKTEFPVEETLKNMGIRDVFEENANLEGISAIKNLFISSVLHSAFICTDEEGTEAAAITDIFYACGGDPLILPQSILLLIIHFCILSLIV